MISIVALKLRLIYLNVDKSLYLPVINNKYFKYQIMISRVAAKILLEKILQMTGMM